MTEEEINKTIAEYAFDVKKYGWDKDVLKHFKAGRIGNYTQSLDALVPVVEKIGENVQIQLDIRKCFDQEGFEKTWYCRLKDPGMRHYHESPSLALATACAKVIKEL